MSQISGWNGYLGRAVYFFQMQISVSYNVLFVRRSSYSCRHISPHPQPTHTLTSSKPTTRWSEASRPLLCLQRLFSLCVATFHSSLTASVSCIPPLVFFDIVCKNILGVIKGFSDGSLIFERERIPMQCKACDCCFSAWLDVLSPAQWNTHSASLFTRIQSQGWLHKFM